jgi:hypothetical protein
MKAVLNLDRRDFVGSLGATAAGLLMGCSSRNLKSELDEYLLAKMNHGSTPAVIPA